MKRRSQVQIPIPLPLYGHVKKKKKTLDFADPWFCRERKVWFCRERREGRRKNPRGFEAPTAGLDLADHHEEENRCLLICDGCWFCQSFHIGFLSISSPPMDPASNVPIHRSHRPAAHLPVIFVPPYNPRGPGSGWLGFGRPPRPTVPATLFFDFFFLMGLAPVGLIFLFFFLMGLALDLVFWGFSLVFHMAPTTFKIIKSQKGLTSPSRF
jgi:hypothetical protein